MMDNITENEVTENEVTNKRQYEQSMLGQLWGWLLGKESNKAEGEAEGEAENKAERFIVVAFAEDMDEAIELKTLLEANDIPTILSKEIAVMVPEDFLDEAHVIVESQHVYDDFYDFELDEDEGNFDFKDLFENGC